ncbi:flagellar hook capping FlgD N-terminal domain-containing protein [Neobacillus novalis]|uniref:Flagellar hook capping FlgD N-terminal domain-containing protein n=1 Tax=Neobacillus novalis TaxID=220687 RepID=A0AA95MS34_9BACI|nr:flagellar hook capping FlgD N-terminal domain-containing protein [Neobacillus novalis]WHY88397.1 flagellar hook capping FlgD N-terminal domain-containing protein [Neobacillus novalis]
MATINALNPYTQQSSNNPQTKELGKEQFLKILVAQLQNQDPTQPMQDGEMISQMAQLSVLEQLSNLNNSLSAYLYLNSNQDNLAQYSSMLDKKVTWMNPETNKIESGIVTGVQYKNGFVYFKIGDQEVLSSAILSVEINHNEVEK